MSFWEAIILGIVQGLTEFLPVSSSGHLLLLQNIFGISDNNVFISVILHLGTFFAVVVVFYKEIIDLFRPPYKKMLYLIIATIPAAVIMLLLKDSTDVLFTEKFMCFGFLITAVVLYITERVQKKYTLENSPITYKHALIMGGAQGIAAVVPGISRSGSTIAAGIVSGAEKSEVARFSFLMSLPAIAGSVMGTMIFDGGAAIGSIGPGVLIAGLAASFLFGMLAIKFMLRLIQRCNYKWFSLYLILLFLLVFTNIYLYKMW